MDTTRNEPNGLTHSNAGDGAQGIGASALIRILQIFADGVDTEQSQLLNNTANMEVRQTLQFSNKKKQTKRNPTWLSEA